MKLPRLLPLLLVALVPIACSESVTTAPGDFEPIFQVAPDDPSDDPVGEFLLVCKDISSPAGTYDFTVTSADPNLNDAFSLMPGECELLVNGGINGMAVVEELTPPAGTQLAKIEVKQRLGDVVNAGDRTLMGQDTAHVTVGGGTITERAGAIVNFFNEAVPGGGEGCTPGYWKQPHHLDSWVGYDPDDDFDTVFGTDLFSPDISLLDGLERRGGGVNALARHAVAALLNAATPGVDYDLSVADVIAAVQAAEASGDYETTKNMLVALNEQGCPLN